MESIEGVEDTQKSDEYDDASYGLLKLSKNLMVMKVIIEFIVRMNRQKQCIKLDAIGIEDEKVVYTEHVINDARSEDPPSDSEHLYFVS